MKRILFLSIVALVLVLTLIVRLPAPVAPAAASPSAHPAATMPTVSAVGVTVTAPATATAVVQPTITPTEAPVVVKPVEPPAEPPAQQQPGKKIDWATLYQLRGVVASQALGKIVNITDYGVYSVRDPLTYQDVELSARDQMRLSAIAATGYDAR